MKADSVCGKCGREVYWNEGSQAWFLNNKEDRHRFDIYHCMDKKRHDGSETAKTLHLLSKYE